MGPRSHSGPDSPDQRSSQDSPSVMGGPAVSMMTSNNCSALKGLRRNAAPISRAGTSSIGSDEPVTSTTGSSNAVIFGCSASSSPLMPSRLMSETMQAARHTATTSSSSSAFAKVSQRYPAE